MSWPMAVKSCKNNKMILKSFLKQTGSQCRDFKNGVMCAVFLVLVRQTAVRLLVYS